MRYFKQYLGAVWAPIGFRWRTRRAAAPAATAAGAAGNSTARANSYEGDLMTNDDFSGAGLFRQTLTFRGNVIIQKTSPLNNSQVIALFNDGGLANLTLSVRALYNTFVGNGGSAAFVHLSNADGTTMSAEISDNIISGTTRPALVENTGASSVTGANNWLRTNAIVGALTGSVQSAAPGFRNVAANDYTLATNSVCIGAAKVSVYGLPGKEYYRDETITRMWRVRAAAQDIGVFESTTTNTSVGPYDPTPLPRLSIAPSGGNAIVSWPLFAADFQLDQSGLSNPILWSQVASGHVTNATNVAATVPSGAGRSFFRLRK